MDEGDTSTKERRSCRAVQISVKLKKERFVQYIKSKNNQIGG